jgi:uncharacterized membrane protein YkvA (DUF1232 family)
MLDSLLAHLRTAGYATLEKILWLYFAAQRPETPAWARATIYAALAYVLSPLDAVPDVLPGGFADDLGVVAAALGTVAVFVDDAVRARTRDVLDGWFA